MAEKTPSQQASNPSEELRHPLEEEAVAAGPDEIIIKKTSSVGRRGIAPKNDEEEKSYPLGRRAKPAEPEENEPEEAVDEPVAEEAAEDVKETIEDLGAEEAVEDVEESVEDPGAEEAVEDVEESVEEPAAEEAVEDVEESVEEPVAEEAAEDTEEPKTDEMEGSTGSTPVPPVESEATTVAESTPIEEGRPEPKKKKGYGLKGLFFRFIGKKPDGTKQARVYHSVGRTLFRYFTVLAVFLAITGIAALVYQIPKIQEEGGIDLLLPQKEPPADLRTDAEKAYDKNATGENLFAYRLKEDGTVAVAGYLGRETRISIPRTIDGKTVTEIDEGAFMGNLVVTVSMYKDITKIGRNAFSGCARLTSITLSHNITQIGTGAFYGCSALTQIILPDGVSEIGDYTFALCTGMREFAIPTSITRIGRSAFESSGLESIVIPSTLRTLDALAFKNCENLKSVTFAEGITVFEKQLFAGCSALETVNIPKSVTVLGERVFESCTALKSIRGGERLTQISPDSFLNANMPAETNYQLILGDGILVRYFGFEPHVAIGATVKVIGEGAFEGNPYLQTVNIPATATVIEARAFRNCTALTQAVLSQGVTKIGAEAFSGCVTLSFMELPITLTEMGQGAFSLCTGLRGVTLPAAMPIIPENAFARCINMVEVKFNKQQVIRAGAFADCKRIEMIVLPNTIINIGDHAFAGCTRLYTITMRNNMLTIGDFAFHGVSAKRISLPATLTYIGESAFLNCPNLIALYAKVGTYANAWAAAHGL